MENEWLKIKDYLYFLNSLKVNWFLKENITKLYFGVYVNRMKTNHIKMGI